MATLNLTRRRVGSAGQFWYDPTPDNRIAAFFQDLLRSFKTARAKMGDKAEPASTSFLLYGPPKTGKNWLAECFCEALKEVLGPEVEFLPRSPADFDLHDPREFKRLLCDAPDKGGLIDSSLRKLTRKKAAVVLFDEIEDAIRSRTTTAGSPWITSASLPLLQGLTKAGRTPPYLFYFINTNRFDEIDEAARSEGRIDDCIMVPPPCRQVREALLRNADKIGLDGSGLAWAAKTIGLSKLSEATAFYTFEELRRSLLRIRSRAITAASSARDVRLSLKRRTSMFENCAQADDVEPSGELIDLIRETAQTEVGPIPAPADGVRGRVVARLFLTLAARGKKRSLAQAFCHRILDDLDQERDGAAYDPNGIWAYAREV